MPAPRIIGAEAVGIGGAKTAVKAAESVAAAVSEAAVRVAVNGTAVSEAVVRVAVNGTAVSEAAVEEARIAAAVNAEVAASTLTR